MNNIRARGNHLPFHDVVGGAALFSHSAEAAVTRGRN
jgi:hypothetical protein